jgi:hypothetical protein
VGLQRSEGFPQQQQEKDPARMGFRLYVAGAIYLDSKMIVLQRDSALKPPLVLE